jgi:hypothetical protein
MTMSRLVKVMAFIWFSEFLISLNESSGEKKTIQDEPVADG